MIVIYSKPHCPYCDKTKHWLTANGFIFEVRDITTDPALREFLIEQNHKTVPQIYAKDGYGDLRLLVAGGYAGLEAMAPEELTERLVNP